MHFVTMCILYIYFVQLWQCVYYTFILCSCNNVYIIHLFYDSCCDSVYIVHLICGCAAVVVKHTILRNKGYIVIVEPG